ncbi:hypothetical protein VCHA53O466_40105 [Vibrio chagasii]|nr:hypothetical protein VCHA53O466_40105 [Vibrio chagasii]
MSITDELSTALALRDEAVRYILDVSDWLNDHEELQGETVVLEEMAIMVSSFKEFKAHDFSGVAGDAIDLFNCVIDYMKFIKHKMGR